MGLIGAAFLAALAGATVGMSRLDAYVQTTVAERIEPRITFVDLPEGMDTLAGEPLRQRLEVLLDTPWTDGSLPAAMAQQLVSSGWVDKVNYVRRTGGGEFLVSCRYYMPLALVQSDAGFFLVDQDSVRLPGVYHHDPSWLLIQGAQRPAPPDGTIWGGADLRAGLSLAATLQSEPMARQITAIIVENFDGRINRRKTHIELATDRAGGRIRWGSAPGLELEENTVAQKLAILRDNFHRTGRIDADHLIIDVSVFADRFIVPG